MDHNYPNAHRQFVNMFTDDGACANYLARLRWPEGFICPICNAASTPWIESRGRLGCPICQHQTFVSASTLQSYLQEFKFRFNRRPSRSRSLVFRRLLEHAVSTQPITEKDVNHGYNWGCNDQLELTAYPPIRNSEKCIQFFCFGRGSGRAI